MQANYYCLAIEALGMQSAKATVRSRLWKVYSCSYARDPVLQKLAWQVMHELQQAKFDTRIIPAIDMRSVPTAKKLLEHCQVQLQQRGI
jgi:hypothetical protein